MTQLLSKAFFQTAYDEMENDLQSRSENNSLCEYCKAKGIPSIFKPSPGGQPSIQQVQQNHGRLSGLATRKDCPFCRVLCQLMEKGAGDTCCGDCRQFYSPTGNPDVDIDVRIAPQPHRRVGAVALLNLPDGNYCNYHICHGDLHFVHPTQADHFRVQDWITTCETSHDSCNEQIRPPDGLFGHGKYALRLIDVEFRMIVKSLHPVRYITLSYVWGASANRKFDMIPNPYPDNSRFQSGIEPVDRQLPEMMFGRLGRTFEDLTCLARRLGERYIWIDAICIPQDEPDILSHQVGLMDQIYFHSILNVVSLSSGVDAGLPGASSATPRNTKQLVEKFPDGSRIATPLWELYAWIQYVPWVTRGWTLQEHLLAKRSIFFTEYEVFFVCKEMSAKESWKHPRTAADREPNDTTERWFEYNIPLPSGRLKPGPELSSTYSTIVQMYTNRYLTFASDRLFAFQGLSARLSESYGVGFLHGHPVTADHLPPSLLWGRLDFRDGEPKPPATSPATTPSGNNWPSWSWLRHPFALSHKHWSGWTDRPVLPTNSPLSLPQTKIQLEINGLFQPLSTSNLHRLLSTATTPPPTLLKIHGLSLDVDLTQWPQSEIRTLPNAMSLWQNKNFNTSRGPITFNMVIIPDLLPSNGNHGLPPGTTTMVRLVHVGNGVDDDLQPRMPYLLERGELNVKRIPPAADVDGGGETEYSRVMDWVEPDYSGKNNHLGVEPDLCLLIVEASRDASRPVKRLGIALVRVMDFLIAGAGMCEVVLE